MSGWGVPSFAISLTMKAKQDAPQQAQTEVLFSKTLSMMMIVFKFAGVQLMRPSDRSAAELLKVVYGEVEP